MEVFIGAQWNQNCSLVLLLHHFLFHNPDGTYSLSGTWRCVCTHSSWTGRVQGVTPSCSQHWGAQPSPGWYPLYLLYPVSAACGIIKYELSNSWILKHPRVFCNIDYSEDSLASEIFHVNIVADPLLILLVSKALVCCSQAMPSMIIIFLRDFFSAPQSSQRKFLLILYLFE